MKIIEIGRFNFGNDIKIEADFDTGCHHGRIFVWRSEAVERAYKWVRMK